MRLGHVHLMLCYRSPTTSPPRESSVWTLPAPKPFSTASCTNSVTTDSESYRYASYANLLLKPFAPSRGVGHPQVITNRKYWSFEFRKWILLLDFNKYNKISHVGYSRLRELHVCFHSYIAIVKSLKFWIFKMDKNVMKQAMSVTTDSESDMYASNHQ